MKDIIKKADEWAKEEIKTYGSPALELFELSKNKGQELAKKFKTDKDIVMLGTILMDIKLGKCLKEGRIKEHIAESAKAAEEFLSQSNMDEDTKKKIINCVKAHHGTEKYTCKEAEICANADCYRFLHPTGILIYIKTLSKERYDNMKDILNQVELKMDEKWNTLSLDVCKDELSEHYKYFKKIIKGYKDNQEK